MAKLPSLQNLFRESAITFKRFPLSILSAITAVLIGMYLIHIEYENYKETAYLIKVIMCCYLGLNIFLATELFAEKKTYNISKRGLLQLFSLLLIVGYYFLLPEVKDFGIYEIARYVLYIIGIHLLIAFAPFINTKDLNGFWRYNKTLFLRFLTSALYSGVLYIGLALALLAIDNLFKIKVNEKSYAYLWLFMVGIFNTWFFLAGIPKDIQTLKNISDYPKGLKVFTQFVLLPLVTIYLFILYAYMGKIVIAMELPKGWVSYLVICFSVAGILSLLLIWPVQEHKENGWIKIFSKWFYRALYPLIILLGFAIYERIAQYGITENRYFILLIAVWLGVIATYFLISKTKNIKLIPISLCTIAFLSSFGPWGAFSVSKRSQINRLEKILVEEKILVDGKIKKAEPELQGEKAKEITEIVDYLDDTHGFYDIREWFNQDLDSIYQKEKNNAYDRYYHKPKILALMGVHETYRWEVASEQHYFSISAESDNNTINIKGFDYYVDFEKYYSDQQSKVIFGNDTISISFKDSTFIVSQYSQQIQKTIFSQYIDSVKNYKTNNDNDHYTIPNERLTLVIETDSLNINFYFKNISGSINKKKLRIDNLSAYILIKRK